MNKTFIEERVEQLKQNWSQSGWWDMATDNTEGFEKDLVDLLTQNTADTLARVREEVESIFWDDRGVAKHYNAEGVYRHAKETLARFTPTPESDKTNEI